MIDEEVEDYANILREHTKPEEWLGHISGNHPNVMSETSQVDPTMNLCNNLGHRYLGYSAFVPLNLQVSGKRLSCMLMCHHGFGGTNARHEGSGINSYIQHAMRFEGFNIALYGHRHDRWVMRVPRISPQVVGGNIIKPQWIEASERLVCQCGTYLRTMARGVYPTYSEKKGYTPKPLGALILKIGMDRTQVNGKDNIRLKFCGNN